MTNDLKQCSNSSDKFDRRTFLGAAAVGAGVMFMKPQLVFGTEANSAVRVGLLGCGGRGTEDASNLVDAGARLWLWPIYSRTSLTQRELTSISCNKQRATRHWTPPNSLSA